MAGRPIDRAKTFPHSRCVSIAELTRTPTESPTTGHQVVVFPSRLVRAVPPFVFATPPGWVVDEAPGAVLAVRAEAAIDEFWSNALLIHDRVASAVDLQAAATASWGRLKSDAPSATTKMERVAKFGENVVYLRGVELDAAQSGRRLAQLHALFFAPAPAGAKTADLFQFVATSTTDQMGPVGRMFVDMVATFRFS
jgi:hypothetical protein